MRVRYEKCMIMVLKSVLSEFCEDAGVDDLKIVLQKW